MCLGVPGLILRVTDAEKKLGVVDVGGVTRTVNLACVIDAEHPIDTCVGTWVLVHVGFAMQRVDEAEAARTLELLRELGEVPARRGGDP
ncbi:HypC/HybG/HupF family hydrogenase formation chaperone [Sorangium sp. So ce1024]|uniref:HypC/HybG/HupF family hydrogenase formation chaperone n=1 Tax=unclassified Sorangium TaxID=2621164 RepID=UPI003EFC7A97